MNNPLTDFIFGTGGFFTLSIIILLFAIGSITFIFRRTLLHMLMAVELMLNAVNLSLIYFSRLHQNHDGQILSLMIFVVAACEVAHWASPLLCNFSNEQVRSALTHILQKGANVLWKTA